MPGANESLYLVWLAGYIFTFKAALQTSNTRAW